MSEVSTKPYLIRAIYEWCSDSGLTPYLVVSVSAQTRVPMEFVKEGQIVLNISQASTRNLAMGNDVIRFSARFGGVPRDIEVPVDSVASIYARENGQGLSFVVEEGADSDGQDQTLSADSEDVFMPDDHPTPPRGKPQLKIVK